MDFFEAYGELAKNIDSHTLISGRMRFQKEGEKKILGDVLSKLQPQKNHHLLEIGCGVGVILTPLSAYVKTAVGLDHAEMIKKYKKSHVPKNVKLFAGRWPEHKIAGKFDRILVYSVLHYLENPRKVKEFIYSCLKILRPGGILLVGDVVNRDKSARFRDSNLGKHLHQKYLREKRLIEKDPESQKQQSVFEHIKKLKPFWNDKFIFSLMQDMRRDGYESLLACQNKELPFCYSREDIIVKKY